MLARGREVMRGKVGIVRGESVMMSIARWAKMQKGRGMIGSAMMSIALSRKKKNKMHAQQQERKQNYSRDC